MHEHNGQPLCSDNCSREFAGDDYAGWNGCHESEFTTYCVQCGVAIAGVTDEDKTCNCIRSNVVVNRFRSDSGETCKHGNWIQLPAHFLNTEDIPSA